MATPQDGLPPLEWIRVFEAAARLGSFTAAAKEIGLTQAAVSQRIRNLELRLGTQLFDREARGVSLSMQGEAWLPHVQTALTQLARSAANLFEAPRRKVTIAASSSVIELWMVPRLTNIAVRMPHLQLSFETIQRLPDYSRAEADFEIRWGEGNWQDRNARRLFAEELVPMATQAIAAEHGDDWQELRRIAVSGPRAGWRDWAMALGALPPPAPLLRFDTFVQALRAAEGGCGILLGSLPLCQATIDDGRLVRLSDKTLPMEAGYWITWPRSRPEFAEREELLDCIAMPTAPVDHR